MEARRPAPPKKKRPPRIVKVYEDGSKVRSDGEVWDPDTKRWRRPMGRR